MAYAAISVFSLALAFKLTFAILLALVLGFYLQLQTLCWSVLTVAIIVAGQTFAAGGESFAGAIYHHSMLGIIGTFNRLFGRAGYYYPDDPRAVVILMLSCLLAGLYTALISPGPVHCAHYHRRIYCPRHYLHHLGRYPFSQRSIKCDIDRALDNLLIHYRPLQLCVNNAPKEEVDNTKLSLQLVDI
ncbi:MAG: p-hydroxybenzoic acid efflux pump subunit AaeB [Sodalis sp.]|nr:MAG: p-hydroxybenzoic acid efflux pump subunit AaeB [Sodalis sp.]